MDEQDWPELGSQSQNIWEANAAFWDNRMGEGNAFNNVLIAPAAERLLAVQPGEVVLDIACGNGVFSRRLAALGAQVVAADFSPTFIELARARGAACAGQIEYRVVDATSREQLLELGLGRFDAIVCNMALMDMSEIDPLLGAIRDLLKPGGRFVFSVSHPCFNSVGSSKLLEEEDRGGEMITRYSIKIAAYIKPVANRGLGIIGQPQAQYYFHRPISLLFSKCFAAGLVMDGIEEPAFNGEVQPTRPLGWTAFTDIPPVLVARLRALRAQNTQPV